MLEQIRKHMKNQEGATAIEYGLMVALIAVAIIVAVTFLAGETCDTFNSAGQSMENRGNTVVDNDTC